MRTRLFKNWITSVLGLGLFLLGCYLTYVKIVDWQVFIASLPTVMLLFRAKDSLLWTKAKN